MCDLARLSRRFKEAVTQLYRDDGQLVDGKVHEQAITAQLARHLDSGLEGEGFDVDCEYNRDYREEDDIKRDQDRARMRPDIIVHRRWTCENLLAIEVKPYWSIADRTEDLARLEYLTGDAFKYALGVHLEIGSDGPTFTWFADGSQIGDPDA